MTEQLVTKRNRKTRPENFERGSHMYNLRLKGLTYQEIGESFVPKLSRQRIHQIVVKHVKRHDLPFIKLRTGGKDE